jgi:hypothetical protein
VSEAEIHGGSNAVEDKLARIGFGKDRIDVRQEAAPEEGTPVETVVDDQPRNELGQFQGQQEEAPDTEMVAEEAPEPQTEDGDPAVAAYLAKYGGDTEKAITAAAHAQRQLGKQSTEVGELRAQNAQYEDLIDELRGLRGDMQEARSNQPLDQGTIDWFDQQVIENPYQAAEYARKQNNQLLLQRALSTWKEVDPYGASVYTNELRLQEQQQQFQQQIAKAQQLPMDSTINVALTNVRSQNPHYSNYDDALAETLQKYPAVRDAIQAAAEAGDTGKLEAAIGTAYALAQGDTLAQVVRTGSTPADTTTTSEVAEPTVSETHEAPATLTQTEQMKAEMNEEIANRRRGVFVAE